MITTKEIKIKIKGDFTSEYIEKSLKNMGLDVLQWVVTNCDKETYTINVCLVE